jgi:hypothetical protein
MTAKKAPAKKVAAQTNGASSNGHKALPGDKDYDWSKEYVGEEFMVYTSSTGKTVALAAAKGDRELLPGDFRRMSHMEDWAKNFYLIEKIASPAALAISDEFRDKDYADMIEAWSKWHGTTAGES